jgi:hypothetical protein
MEKGSNQTEFNDYKDFYEERLHENIHYYLKCKKNNINIRKLSKIPNFYKNKSNEHSISHTIDKVISVTLSNILNEAKRIVETYKENIFDYNAIYFKLEYNESINPNIITGKVILYYQTNENIIEEIKNGLDLLKTSDKDSIKDYLKKSTSLFV